MPAYDQIGFDPPAPLAHVTLRNPDDGTVLADVPMLIDSGADITLLPADLLQSLGMSTVAGKQYELTSFDGSTHLAAIVRAELVFCRRSFRGRFPLIEQDWGILGRNVLNALAIVFDGPKLVWNEAAATLLIDLQ